MQRSRRRRPAWPAKVALAVGALLTLLSWSLASAPGSAPDDTYHLASIWCAQGTDASRCQSADDPSIRGVPHQTAGVSCFSQNAALSGACQEEFPDELVVDTFTSIGNWNTSYPPVFYLAMSLAVTDDLEVSVFLMRAMSSLLIVGMVLAVAWLLPSRLRHLVIVPILVTSVPLGLSLLASTNPTSWAILGAATLWPALYGAGETAGRRRHLLLALGLVSVVVGSGSRGDAALFSIMAIGLVVLLRARQWRSNLDVVLVGALGVVVSILLFLGAGQSSAVTGGVTDSESMGIPWFDLAVTNAQELPILLLGGFGFGGMGTIGWLDTPFPSLVAALSLATWIAVVFASFRDLFPAKVVVVLVAGTALLAYPMLILGRTGVTVGQAFQPRYALPVLVVFTGLCLLARGRRPGFLTTPQAMTVAVMLSIAHLVALKNQIRRYVTGLDETGFNLDAGREWWWAIPIPATLVWIVGSTAFLVSAALAMGTLRGAEAAGDVAAADGAARPVDGIRPAHR